MRTLSKLLFLSTLLLTLSCDDIFGLNTEEEIVDHYNGPKLFGTTVANDNTAPLGHVITDGEGNSIGGFFKAGTTDLELIVQTTSAGTVAYTLMGDNALPDSQVGYPFMLTDEQTSVIFTNWTDSTVDMTFMSSADGTLETVTNVDYTDYVDKNLLGPNAARDWSWGNMAKLSWTLGRLAVCGATIGGALATGGWSLLFASVTCAGSTAEGIAILVNGVEDSVTGWTAVENAWAGVQDWAKCHAMEEGYGLVDARDCTRSAAILAAQNPLFVDDEGNVQTQNNGQVIDDDDDDDDNDDDINGGYAGSCDQRADQGICVNYIGDAHTAQGVQDACAQNGQYLVNECPPTADSFGACYNVVFPQMPSSDYHVTIVYYTPLMTEEGATTNCDLFNGNYVPYYE